MTHLRDSEHPLTIVTAYYDLDLMKTSPKSYKSERSHQTYLDFFRYWVGLKNPMVIYTDDLRVKDQVYAMRKAHHLEHQTHIIQKDLQSFDPKALTAIRETFDTYDQSYGRFDPHHPPHTSPEYDYLMYCKSFFICDAIDRGLSEEEVIWLDFGYNQGGLNFTNPKQFDFSLQPQKQIKKDKINFFLLTLDERGGGKTLPYILMQGANSFLTGGLIYGDRSSWQKFNAQMQEALQAFISFNVIDDDQKLYIWCVRNHPEIFHTIPIGDWFDGLLHFIPESIQKNISLRSAPPPEVFFDKISCKNEIILETKNHRSEA